MANFNGKQLWLPLGSIIAIVTVVLAVGFWLNAELGSLKMQMQALQFQLVDLWTTRDMEVWILRFGVQNPSLNIPDPRRVAQRLPPLANEQSK